MDHWVILDRPDNLVLTELRAHKVKLALRVVMGHKDKKVSGDRRD